MDWEDSRWWGIALGVCGKLTDQPKVELDQLVVPGVFGPHGCTYFPNGTKVLFHGPLLDGGSAGFQKAGVHALSRNMEERYRVSYALEFGWDIQPLA